MFRCGLAFLLLFAFKSENSAAPLATMATGSPTSTNWSVLRRSHFPKADNTSMDWRTGKSKHASFSAIDDNERPRKMGKSSSAPYFTAQTNRWSRHSGQHHTVSSKTRDPQLQSWLKEGLLARRPTSAKCIVSMLEPTGNFQALSNLTNRCIELMNRRPRQQPVDLGACVPAIRLTAPSPPRFFGRNFHRTTPLTNSSPIDSSVRTFLRPTTHPYRASLVMDASGAEKFRKIHPLPSFVTTIEDYPYPYVIGKLCWDSLRLFRAMEAQRHHGVNTGYRRRLESQRSTHRPQASTLTMIFHPHGWIRTSNSSNSLITRPEVRDQSEVSSPSRRQERLNQKPFARHPAAASHDENGVPLLRSNPSDQPFSRTSSISRRPKSAASGQQPGDDSREKNGFGLIFPALRER